MADKENVFSVFDDISPRKREPSIQVLYEYEKHYMELLKRYSGEITFIEQMLQHFREEQITFFKETLPEISDKLDREFIDANLKKVWLERLAINMDRSFSLSETLITDYTTKKLNEFKAAVDEKLRNV